MNPDDLTDDQIERIVNERFNAPLASVMQATETLFLGLFLRLRKRGLLTDEEVFGLIDTASRHVSEGHGDKSFGYVGLRALASHYAQVLERRARD